uniref:Uncharacterized protein n=1 Tax=Arundo donax TaxID=35708 RepID=A0A0A9FWE1_ARUDO
MMVWRKNKTLQQCNSTFIPGTHKNYLSLRLNKLHSTNREYEHK